MYFALTRRIIAFNINTLLSMDQMLARPRFFEVSKILTILRLFLINMLLIKKSLNLRN